jgi:6,7-dimethyl-8-ribityllumazine synthase
MNFKFDKDNNDNFLKDKKIAITVGYFYQEIGDKLLIGAAHTRYIQNQNAGFHR